ncbi:aspartate aminotransferase family protein [Pseudoroseomonas globiformis]|uniref:Aspartate aminotransferase family protein n=1 Tax=Teichococcus globiformis TaxID=2307229 RepID=A0ABV7FW26_9PROT
MTPPPANPAHGANSPAARDIAHVLHPYTDHKAHREKGPLVITGGRGVYVSDENGKEYLETVAGLWCAGLGFQNERLVQAAAEQMRKLPFYHAFTGRSHMPLIELSEMLIERAPVPMSKAFFANSGSEANDTALKMIWYMNNALGRPQKKKVISRIGGYHGVTVAAASLTGLPANHKLFDLPIAGILHTSRPHHYHNAQPGESEEEFATRLAAELEEMIVREGPDTVAGFFAEPVMGAGGVIVPPATYFEKIQAVLRKYDVLLVADEVICGFGRTGSYWGSQTMGMQPDILTCAKALSSSYLPISGVLVNERVYEALSEGSSQIGTWGHGYTYSGHPVAAAVAVETLKIYDEMDIVSHAAASGAVMQKRLREAVADHPLVGEVRGIGLIGAVELVENKAEHRNFDPAKKVAAKLVALGEEHGLILRALPNDSIAFSPPQIITPDEVEIMVTRFSKALDALSVQLRREGLAVV